MRRATAHSCTKSRKRKTTFVEEPTEVRHGFSELRVQPEDGEWYKSNVQGLFDSPKPRDVAYIWRV